MLTNRLPLKLKDPGSFTIPCAIEPNYSGKALCDLGASINLMPMSIFKQLAVGEARPTTVTLKLVDRSKVLPEGKIKDVLVKIDKFIFPVDFIILDFEADHDVPILLGRPFMATARMFIDVEKGELTMRVDNDLVTFSILKNMKFKDSTERNLSCSDTRSILEAGESPASPQH
ncbi:hypothetical protein QN277_009504 [Acacia crassicarpa]|uniref:Aspartic peptidase DDI1-type domain-containing protein n=1 Tax=Acacia crassicarpa TaxID=499986 RepID=A0AAE1JM92_9FABA|nr:hypothetical protein QN277_009504 [Acacia crassicarpa]